MIVMSMGHVRTLKAHSTVPVTLVSQEMALSVQTSMNVTQIFTTVSLMRTVATLEAPTPAPVTQGTLGMVSTAQTLTNVRTEHTNVTPTEYAQTRRDPTPVHAGFGTHLFLTLETGTALHVSIILFYPFFNF